MSDRVDEKLLWERQWRLCKASFPHFFLRWWKVVLDGETIGVEERREQLESAQIFQDERRIVVLKARQIGWTTLVTAYVFWRTFFHARRFAIVLSRREDPEAVLIIRNIKFG